MFFPILIASILQSQKPQDLSKAAKPPVAPSASTVVATVNGQAVKAGDVESYLWNWMGPQAIKEVVGLKIVEQEAKKEGVSATSAEILERLSHDIEQVEQQKKANDPAPNESAVEYLTQEGFPLTRLYLRSKIEVLATKMALKKFNPSDFVDVSTAVFRAKDQAASSVANAADRANNGYKELGLGIKWIDILKATGAPPNVLQDGGKLGWRMISAFPAEIQQDLRTLKPGSYTKPVQTSYGFQIFKIDALGSSATPAELASLKKEFVRSESQIILSQLRQNAKVTYLLPK